MNTVKHNGINIVVTFFVVFFSVVVFSSFMSDTIIPTANATAQPSPFISDLTISHPPKLGEEAQLTLQIVDRQIRGMPDYRGVIDLPEGFELVDGILDKTEDLEADGTFEITATIKAIKTGNWTIVGGGTGGSIDVLYVAVSEDDAYLNDGHFPPSIQYATPIDPANVSIGNNADFSFDSSSSPNKTKSWTYVDADIDQMQPIPQISKYDYDAFLESLMLQQSNQTSSNIFPDPSDDQIAFSGKINYLNKQDNGIPAAGVKVCVLDIDPDGNEVITTTNGSDACVLADDEGDWEIGPIDNVDDDGGKLDVILTFESTHPSFSVIDSAKKTYTYTLGPFENISASFLGLTTTISPVNQSTDPTKAFWIFAAMYDGWKFFNDLGFDHQDDDAVTVLWTDGIDANYFPRVKDSLPILTAHYNPNEKEIRLTGLTSSLSPNEGGGNANDPFTILHEYSHHVMNIVYTNSGNNESTAYNPLEMRCFNFHNMDEMFIDEDGDPSPRCAWIEGWANFVPLAVTNSSTYQATESNTNVDFESGTGTISKRLVNWQDKPGASVNSVAIEGRITSALWDILDSSDESVSGEQLGEDKFNASFEDVWNVFNGMSVLPNEDRPADDFIEWWHDWIKDNPETISQTQNILKFNKIGDEDHESINTLPVAVDIPVSVFVDTPTEITLEAGDNDYDPLTFSIETFPDKGTLGDITQNGSSSAPIESTVQSAKVTYFPDADLESDSFSFKTSDGIESVVGTVNITVDDTFGETIVLSDEFIDFTHWDSSGDGDVEKWEIIADDDNGGPNGKIVSSKNCDDYCYLTIKDGIKLTGYVDPTISFSWLVSNKVDGDEGLYLEVFDDGLWKELGSWTAITGAHDGVWHIHSPPISLDDYISLNVELRFVAKSSNSPEMVQIDNVVIRANPDGSGSGEDNKDKDKDGISDSLDTEIDNPSDDFSDVSLPGGGTTSGSIIKRGGQDFVIVDSDDENKGVAISTNIIDSDNTLSEVSLCEDDAILKMNDGDSLAATCGSVILDGTKGKIAVSLNSDDDGSGSGNTFTTRLDENDSLTFDPTIPSLTTTDTSGTLKIKIEDSSLVFDLLSGDTLSPPVESPIDVLANSTSHNQIELFWTAPTNDGGAPITGYKIERESVSPGVEEGFVTIKLHTNSTDTTFVDDGDGDDSGLLLPDTQYNYQVYAINDIGTSSIASAVASATTTTSPPPIDTILSTVTIPNPTPGFMDVFGWTVGGIGNDKVVVGMHHDESGGIVEEGSALVFHANNGTQITPLENPDPDVGDNFGYAVAGIGDDKIVVGTRASDPDDLSWTGSAYVFDANDGSLITPLENPNPGIYDGFGWSVAGVGDDKVVVSTDNDEPNGMKEIGGAYVFDANNGTMLFTLDNPRPGVSSHGNFGHAVAGVGDDKIVVGAPVNSDNPSDTFHAGAAYVFDAVATGEMLVPLDNPNPDPYDSFGWSVAGLGDNKVVVGAPNDEDNTSSIMNNTGTAYVFDATTGKRLLTIPNPTPNARDDFGYAVAGIGDDMIVVSAPRDSDNPSDTHSAGAAYIFDATTGKLLVTLYSPDHEISKEFGHAVAGIGDNKVIVGSPWTRDSDKIDGIAYIFELGSGLESDPATAATTTSSSSSSVP